MRWSAWRVEVESIALWLSLLLVGVVLNWDDFDQANPLTWYIATIALLEATLIFLHATMELRRRKGPT